MMKNTGTINTFMYHKKIIQSKIKRVVYLNLKNSKHIPANVAMEMFEAAGVEVVKYEPTGREITIIV